MTERPPLIDHGPRERAVSTFGRDVLVAASAGTGKTTILTERVLYALTALGLDVTRILVLTFTEAAAEEMRGRIAQQLRRRCEAQRDRRLRAQLRRLDAAPISTIHAFCKRTLDTYFYRANLDPAVQILDEDEGRLLLAECLQQGVAAAWEDAERIQSLRALFDGRSPDSVLGHVQDVYRFLEGMPAPAAWLAQAREKQVRGEGPSRELQSLWLDYHLRDLEEHLALACTLDRALCDASYVTPLIQKSIQPMVDACRAALKRGDIAAVLKILDACRWPRLPGGKSPWPQEARDRVKHPFGAAKKTFDGLTGAALLHPEYGPTYGAAECVQGQALLDLVERLRDAYGAAKQERRVLDYADLEHRLLALLEKGPEVREALRDQYDAVLVDEYQDVNAVQQAILDHVRRAGGFFAVGDVKQSIYGFRQARPGIFLEALAGAEEGTNAGSSLRLDLQTNFRCHPDIIAFVNAVFARLMQAQMGGVCYDPRAHLLPGRNTNTSNPVEIAVLDSDTGDAAPAGLGGISDTQRQAAWIATRIGALITAGVTVPDRDTGLERALTYGDIVILLRSPAGRAHIYAEVLRLAGIPVSSQSSAGYFASTEVLDILALLRVLDNPHQDVELAAVLRSALLGFSDADLAEIQLQGRSQGRPSDFCGSVQGYASTGAQADLRARLAEALDRLETWRDQVRRGRLADMLWHVFRTTGYLSYVSALPNGAQRRANLLKFHDRAMHFQSEGSEVSLGGFVAFLEGLLGQRQDWAPAEPDSACVDAVRIMSIHRSKGLEFPVVILADLEHRFNLSAAQGACLTDETLGLGLAVADAIRNITVKSPTHEVIALQRRDQDLAEELRILYVAATRARERLILCGYQSHLQAEERRDLGRLLPGQVIPATVLRGAHCVLDWLLYALPAGVDYQEIAFDDLQVMAMHLIDRQQSLLEERRALAACDPGAEEDQVARLVKACRRPYAFAAAVPLPAKQSVSDLTHRDDAFAQLDLERALTREPRVVREHRPRAKTGTAARERGTALHLVIETLPLTAGSPPTVEDIREHAQALAAQGRIGPAVLTEKDMAAVFNFFQGPTGSQCFAADTRVWREWPFTLAVCPRDGGPTATAPDVNSDFIIVQGIVDLLIQRPTGVLVVDYKTDTVGFDQIEDRVASYRGQLDLYAQAVQCILGKPVLGKVLFFTALNREVSV
jgi:ATP-dependent helicase/nuclease subunit A